jgi:hypothetical protein
MAIKQLLHYHHHDYDGDDTDIVTEKMKALKTDNMLTVLS